MSGYARRFVRLFIIFALLALFFALIGPAIDQALLASVGLR